MTNERTFRQGNDRIAELAANPQIAEEVARVRQATEAADEEHSKPAPSGG